MFGGGIEGGSAGDVYIRHVTAAAVTGPHPPSSNLFLGSAVSASPVSSPFSSSVLQAGWKQPAEHFQPSVGYCSCEHTYQHTDTHAHVKEYRFVCVWESSDAASAPDSTHEGQGYLLASVRLAWNGFTAIAGDEGDAASPWHAKLGWGRGAVQQRAPLA